MNTLPKIIKIDLEEEGNWQVHLYEEYADILYPNKKINSKLLDEIRFSVLWQSPYRITLKVDSFPYLVAFYPEKKKVFIGSTRLSRELVLLKWYEVYRHFQFNDDVIERVNLLQEHTQNISSLNYQDSPTVIERLTYKNNLAKLWKDDSFKKIDEKANELASDLKKRINSYKTSLFEKLSDFGLNLAANYALIRVHLLKFLAILPCLEHDKNGKEVKRILLETLRRLNEDSKKARFKDLKGQNRALPLYIERGCALAFKVSSLLPAKFLSYIVRTLTKLQAKRFIAGENIKKVSKTIKSLKRTNRDCTLDQLGELVVSKKEADLYLERVLEVIRGLNKHYKKGEKNKAGIYRAHVSVKVSALADDFRPYAFDYLYQNVAPRLKKILIAAKDEEVFLNIDAEHYHFRDVVFEIYSKILLETSELKDWQQTGIVLQAYLRDAYCHYQDIVQLAKKRNLVMPIRLVKGAYWDAETIEAVAHNFKAPQFLNKEETDIHFRQLVNEILKDQQYVQLTIASHNLYDHCWSKALRETYYPQAPVIEHQCLHMTYEALSTGLAKAGLAVRNYIPIGDLLVGMAYLVRRIMENSSQVGVLTMMRSHKRKEQLASPQELFFDNKEKLLLQWDDQDSLVSQDFINASVTRLYLRSEREAFFKALESTKNNLGKDFDSGLSGEISEIRCGSEPNLVVGKIANATIEDCENAIKSCQKKDWWSDQKAILRYSSLLNAADLMLMRKNEFASLIVYEAGKSLEEALADVDEAVDFINFYVREQMKWARRFPMATQRGIMAVISPWNFPLAIPVGMVTSALSAGNSVLLKSAEQTPLVAQKFVDLFHEAGVPKNRLIHLPGEGETIGAYLVAHEDISGVVFTGSKAVGLKIYEQVANELVKKDNGVFKKKVIAEMGGKNAIIVTNNSELDETVSGILYSCYAHSGQKCSAASRIIVHKSIKESFLERFIEASRDIVIERAYIPHAYLNPLISAEDKKRIQNIAVEACKEAVETNGRVLLDRSQEELPGYCVGPVVIELSASESLKKTSWAQKEVFGPVIHIIEYENLDQAIELFNSSEYALTGGIFSQSQDDIDYLMAKLQAGNIYVNRPNTGARVAIEPFGGFKLSGTGPKAGSAQYLKAFHVFSHAEDNQEIKSNDFNEDYEVANMSLRLPQNRLECLVPIFAEFGRRLNHFFPNLSEIDKEKYHSFKNWVSNNYLDYQEGIHPNFFIPGQLSYNSKHMQKPSGMLVAHHERPHFRSFLHFMSALCVGSGITVLCRNQSSYDFWNQVIEIVFFFGIGENNINIFKVSDTKLKTALENEAFSFIIIDSNTQYTQKYLKLTINNGEYLKSFHTPFNGPPYYDWEGYLDQFILVRSFAINTMRHGAPLELSL
jgi:RHH-type proline utilization regulon transcriptional repressor/proline dehydrogenase/delta 1-pyrroline-5-carboxylate dehydrogenase